MKKVFSVFIFLLNLSLFAHTINYDKQLVRHWNTKNNTFVEGSFSMYKNGCVYIEGNQNELIKIPISRLTEVDQKFALSKISEIDSLNHLQEKTNTSTSMLKFSIVLVLLIGLGYLIQTKIQAQKRKYLYPILTIGIVMSFYSFSTKKITTTDPLFVNAAFTPFVPQVNTSWDNTYFYVESKGIPNHTIMVGISNHGWQQQVPIPQCYIGSNHWSIPLNPVIASTPIAVDNVHFTRGAIAIAANGVPIFNYHTNTGVDSYLDGQLDNYGGHCGRGDDYHYHIAPTHLYTLGQTTTDLPCAFSLDGFAVYGNVEPDGSPMLTLDANHGHYGTNGVYHYHGTATAPYMIGSFVGQVTEDATYQLIPQAAAHPVRNENWTPLSGALITSCTPNTNNNGYTVAYSLNGTPGYATSYTWSGTTYSFNYVTPSATTTTNYNGFTQCTVPLSNAVFATDQSLHIYPNPNKGMLFIDLGNDDLINEIQNISIIGVQGNVIYKTTGFQSKINIQNLVAGTYYVKFQFVNTTITKKLLVE